MDLTYNQAKKKANERKRMISLGKINEQARLYFHIEFKKGSVLRVAEAIAQGKIQTPMNYLPFKKVILAAPKEEQSLLLKQAYHLLHDMIDYTHTQNSLLYKNAYIAMQKMGDYRNLRKALKQYHHDFSTQEFVIAINPYEKDGNIWHYLEEYQQQLMGRYMEKDEVITNADIFKALCFEEIFLKKPSQATKWLIGIENFMEERHIPYLQEETIMNENYRQLYSYFQYFEDYMLHHEQLLPRTMIDRSTNLKKQGRTIFGKRDFISDYENLIQKMKDYNVLTTVKQYQDHEPFNAFCARHQLSTKKIKASLKTFGEKEALEKLEAYIEKTKLNSKLSKEQEMLKLIQYLEPLIASPDALEQITLAHYYALTDISVDHMIKLLANHGYTEYVRFLSYFYEENKQNEQSYQEMPVNKTLSIYLEHLLHQAKVAGYPKKIGIMKEALHFAKEDKLDQFTKSYYLEDWKRLLKKEQPKVQKKV